MRTASSRRCPWSTHEARPRRGDLLRRRSCMTRSCCICSRGTFPTRLGADAAGRARNDQRRGQRQPGELVVGGLYAAGARCVCEGYGRHGEVGHQRDRQGRPAACADAAGGRDAESDLSRRPRPALQFSKDGTASGLLRRQRVGLRSQSAGHGDEQGDRDHPRVPRREGRPGDARRPSARSSSCGCACARHERDRVPQIAIVDLLPGGVEPVLELQPPADSSEAGVDPALMRQRAQCVAAGWRARAIGLGPEPCRRARRPRSCIYGDATKDAGTFVYRVQSDQRRPFQVPPAFAEGMYNRTHRRVEPGRQAGGREAVNRRRLPCRSSMRSRR